MPKNAISINDDSVISQIKERNQGAFRLLFDAYYKSLYAYATKFVGAEIAHDAVQDLFSGIWQKGADWNITSSLHNYLFTGVRNNCLQWLEKQKVRDRYMQESAWQLAVDEVNFYHSGGDGAQSLLETELQYKVDEAISKLPPQCQKVFRMSRLEVKKNREIADELDISQKAVEKQLTKALKFLREELKEYMPFLLILLG